jgi:hypothetical protein
MAVFWVVTIIALMMEAARTSETLVNFYQTTRCYNPEDSNLQLTLLFSPRQTDATDCDYTVRTSMCVVLHFLLWPVWRFYSNESVFTYFMSVTQSVRKTLHCGKIHCRVKQQIKGLICNCSTRIFIMLLVTVFSLFCAMLPF